MGGLHNKERVFMALTSVVRGVTMALSRERRYCQRTGQQGGEEKEDKQADEDADFEALVREKIEQGKVKRGGSWMVAKFQLEKDKRFKVVKRRAEQLYKDITRKMTNEEEPEKPNESGDREEEQPAKRARVDAPAEEDDDGVTFDPDDYE